MLNSFGQLLLGRDLEVFEVSTCLRLRDVRKNGTIDVLYRVALDDPRHAIRINSSSVTIKCLSQRWTRRVRGESGEVKGYSAV